MEMKAGGAPLGIVGGSAFLEDPELHEAQILDVETAREVVRLRAGDGFVFLRRHGEEEYHPPHRISHHAHVLAFEALGVTDVIGLASTGSLRADLVPGTLVVPDDYLSRHSPPTFAGNEYLHVVPELSPSLREFLLATIRGSSTLKQRGAPLEDGGVYAETTGPRFETRAEVRTLARDAHVVGMTAASEATLFQEREIRYAMLCIIDNWANGVGSEPLTLEAFHSRRATNGELMRGLLRELLGAWRGRRGSE